MTVTRIQDRKTARVLPTISDCEPGWAVQDFLRNNRGINDGADLPEEYMCNLYNSIVSNEIKMKVNSLLGLQADSQYVLIPGQVIWATVPENNPRLATAQGHESRTVPLLDLA